MDGRAYISQVNGYEGWLNPPMRRLRAVDVVLPVSDIDRRSGDYVKKRGEGAPRCVLHDDPILGGDEYFVNFVADVDTGYL